MKLLQPTFRIASFMLLLWAGVMLLPALATPGDGHASRPFILAAGTCLLLALALHLAVRGTLLRFQPRTLFIATACNWLLLCFTGTLPWLYSGLGAGFVDVLFETVSGVTTTGASVFGNPEALPRGLLLWRSLTQCVGGIGIIIVVVAILPSLKAGGMRLFRSESSEWAHLERGRIAALAGQILLTYAAITIACVVSYRLFGMSWFDALNHAMTTVSTGGFSTHGESFGFFRNSHLQFVASLFMILGACPFLLIVASLQQRKALLWRDRQVRLLLQLVLANAVLISIWRWHQVPTAEPLRLLESSLFNVISIITTTGFASEDYTLWGSFPIMVMAFLMFCGACSGSTSGGIKLFRFQLLGIFMREQVHTALHPTISYHRRYNGRPIPESILVGSLAFLFCVILSWSLCSCLLAATGLDPVTSASGALTALMNVGPGFGATIGPVGNFGTLSDPAKAVLIIAMLLGRLEFLALVILFTREFWKW